MVQGVAAGRIGVQARLDTGQPQGSKRQRATVPARWSRWETSSAADTLRTLENMCVVSGTALSNSSLICCDEEGWGLVLAGQQAGDKPRCGASSSRAFAF